MKYVAYDEVTGWMGHAYYSHKLAYNEAVEHNDGCADQGGYGSAKVYNIGKDKYIFDDNGDDVWPPHGRSNGAVSI